MIKFNSFEYVFQILQLMCRISFLYLFDDVLLAISECYCSGCAGPFLFDFLWGGLMAMVFGDDLLLLMCPQALK